VGKVTWSARELQPEEYGRCRTPPPFDIDHR
jgi:hypothetical protein